MKFFSLLFIVTREKTERFIPTNLLFETPYSLFYFFLLLVQRWLTMEWTKWTCDENQTTSERHNEKNGNDNKYAHKTACTQTHTRIGNSVRRNFFLFSFHFATQYCVFFGFKITMAHSKRKKKSNVRIRNKKSNDNENKANNAEIFIWFFFLLALVVWCCRYVRPPQKINNICWNDWKRKLENRKCYLKNTLHGVYV